MNTQMLREITETYGDLNHPNWFSMRRRHEAIPYQKVESQIREFADIKDEMDYNNDYMVVYAVCSSLGELWLHISLIGRYAYVGGINGKILSESELLSDELGRKILEVIRRERIAYMTKEEMQEEIFFNNEKTLLYNVLFSAIEPLWDL